VQRRLWAKLSELAGWLLIYDNVDDPADLGDLRPPDRGRLLVTSRRPAVGRLAPLVEVPEFDRAESLLLLRKRCPSLSDEEADQIAAAVGDLPLAVEQAGCFITETAVAIADYLQLLAARPAAAGLADTTLDRHPGLAAVVIASRARLHTCNPCAAALLDQMAFLAPEPLPLSPRRDGNGPVLGVQVGDPAATATAVRDLTGLGLARRIGTALQVHRLVQALLRARLSAAEQTRTRLAAQQLLATVDPGDPDDVASWAAYAAVTPHVEAAALHGGATRAETEPEQFRALLLRVCRYLYVSGRYRAGRDLAARTYQKWTASLGGDHADTLTSASSLANHLRGLGEYASARELDEDTLARRRRVLGDDHPATLRSAHSVAADLYQLHKFAAAHDKFNDTLNRMRHALGDDNPDTLTSAHGVAAALRALRDYPSARDRDTDTLARRRRVLGDDHPDTLTSAHSLAIDLRGLHDFPKARDRDTDTLARRRRVLGDDHPDTLTSAHSLANNLRALGEYASARELDEDTLTRLKRVLGDDHPDTLTSAHNLAEDLHQLGEVAAARDQFKDTLTRRRRVLGDDHRDTLSSEHNLAAVLASLAEHAHPRDQEAADRPGTGSA
jgi:hypothetical protein